MEKPELPTKSELERAEFARKGGAADLLERYLDSSKGYDDHFGKKLNAEVRQQERIHQYRFWGVAFGSALAIMSLMLCGYSIKMNVNILPISVVLGPLAAFAGVFIWGYRPKNGSTISRKELFELLNSEESENTG